jgi:hypothetical protein
VLVRHFEKRLRFQAIFKDRRPESAILLRKTADFISNALPSRLARRFLQPEAENSRAEAQSSKAELPSQGAEPTHQDSDSRRWSMERPSENPESQNQGSESLS